MTKKRKQRNVKDRRRIAFPAFELFPTSDILGLDLLCLMSAYNDMLRIVEWMEAYKHEPKDALARKLDEQRRSMQWRLLLGVLHETLESMKRMNGDARFKELFLCLDNDGLNAYQELMAILGWKSSGVAKPLGAFLGRVRNRGAFHYIRNHFRDGLIQLKESFDSVEDGFVLEGNAQKGKIRFSFADTVRNAAAFGAKQDLEQLNLELAAQVEGVPRMIELLTHFLQSAFFSYSTLRGFEPSEDGNHFRIQRIKDP
jgi:hypothetical protein